MEINSENSVLHGQLRHMETEMLAVIVTQQRSRVR